MKDFVYIVIRINSRRMIKKCGGMAKALQSCTKKFPLIGELLGTPTKPLTYKPILTRMGKGKGKVLDYYLISNKGSVVFAGYIPNYRVKNIVYRMKKEGILKSDGIFTVTLFYL